MLQRTTINIDEEFFAAGSESLLVVHLIDRIRHRLDIGLAAVDFFDAPTILAQASVNESKLPVMDNE